MPKRKAKSAPRYAKQPAVAAILKMARRNRRRGRQDPRGLQQHTVRSVLSRLGSKAELVLTRTKVEARGGLLYRAAAKATAARSRRRRSSRSDQVGLSTQMASVLMTPDGKVPSARFSQCMAP
jgi:hypothetical protein